MKLSIIIPLYNEEKTIGEVIDKLLNISWPENLGSYEIIIVDDCSSDNSYDIALKYTEKHPEILLKRHEINQGKGKAVKTGFEYSSGSLIIFQDADLELDPNDIPYMIEALINLDVDMVNGSRYLAGKIRPCYNYRRYLANKFFTRLTAILINVQLTDVACGYKLVKRRLFEDIHFKENRFGFEAELIIKALKRGANKTAEVPVSYFPRNKGEGKKLNYMDGFRILKTIIKYGIFK